MSSDIYLHVHLVPNTDVELYSSSALMPYAAGDSGRAWTPQPNRQPVTRLAVYRFVDESKASGAQLTHSATRRFVSTAQANGAHELTYASDATRLRCTHEELTAFRVTALDVEEFVAVLATLTAQEER